MTYPNRQSHAVISPTSSVEDMTPRQRRILPSIARRFQSFRHPRVTLRPAGGHRTGGDIVRWSPPRSLAARRLHDGPGGEVERLPGARNLGHGRGMRVILAPFFPGASPCGSRISCSIVSPRRGPPTPTPLRKSSHDFRCSAAAEPSGRRGAGFRRETTSACFMRLAASGCWRSGRNRNCCLRRW